MGAEFKKTATRATLATLNEVPDPPRLKTKIDAVDEVLNGGLPIGSVIIISGPPGIGKTTLLLHIADKMASASRPLSYIAPEMKDTDIAAYAKRLGVKNPHVHVFGLEGDICKVTDDVEKNGSKVMIVDSLQAAFHSDSKGAEGSAEQCKAVASYLTWWAKEYNVSVFLVSHVNKDGDLAGPKAAEHLVDGTLEFDPAIENDEDGVPIPRTQHWRKLTSGPKFRIGPSYVSRTFEMVESGIKPVKKKPDRSEKDSDRPRPRLVPVD
jgi:DNA repair protein RadA/Sms